jgi:hypothetical protein
MSITFSVENTPLEMNVANRSAAIILYNLLGYGESEVELWGGELDPSDVLRRLAISETKAPSLVTPTRESRGVYMDKNGVGEGCRVIECGYPLERIMRYVTTIQIMAEQAKDLGEVISYG